VITIVGYCVIVVTGLTVEARARRGSPVIPRLDTVVRWVLRTRSGRIGLFAAWAWMGLHFLG